jgi:hypothetical protein
MKSQSLWLAAAAAVASIGVGSAIWQGHSADAEHAAVLQRVAAIDAQPLSQGWYLSNGAQAREVVPAHSAPGFATFDLAAFCSGAAKASQLGIACAELLSAAPQ